MANKGFVHIEIPATDRAESGKFYEKVFGWEVTPMEDMGYTMFQSGNVGGGFPNLSADSVVIKKDRVLVYLDSDDIDGDLKKVEAAGGKVVHPKEEIPGWGWWAGFTDPTGNLLGLYQGMPKS